MYSRRVLTTSRVIHFITIILFAFLANHISFANDGTQTAPVENTETGNAKIINVKLAAEMREKGAFILDVREPEEWQEMHIPESILIPLGQLQNRLHEIPKDRDIVLVCRSGSRSRVALDFLRYKGFLKSSSMQGGIQLWRQVGYPVEEGY